MEFGPAKTINFRLSKRHLGGDPQNDGTDITCVRVADFDRKKLSIKPIVPTTRSVSAREREGRLVQKGDLLLEKSGGGDLQPVGAVMLYERQEPSICSNFIARIELATGMVSSYWRYVHSAIYEARLNTRSIKQTSGIQNLDQAQYLNEKAPFPPADEQTLIAVFLDRETAKIDDLVAEQERLIALLKEKRQAVISHAVTKGLNSDAPIKDSGVEWLGEVPASWLVVPLGYRYQVQLGKMLDTAKVTGQHLRPYLRVFDVQWGKINTDALPEMDFSEKDRKKYSLRQGDLMVNEGGSYVGRSAIWRGEIPECYYQKALHRLRPRNTHSDCSEFLYYVMENATKFGVFVAGGNQATIEHLTAEALRRYMFAFPDYDEQVGIAAHLDDFCAGLDRLISEAEMAIILLKERRAALISAAVTGKIDVRGLVDTEEAA